MWVESGLDGSLAGKGLHLAPHSLMLQQTGTPLTRLLPFIYPLLCHQDEAARQELAALEAKAEEQEAAELPSVPKTEAAAEQQPFVDLPEVRTGKVSAQEGEAQPQGQLEQPLTAF